MIDEPTHLSTNNPMERPSDQKPNDISEVSPEAMITTSASASEDILSSSKTGTVVEESKPLNTTETSTNNKVSTSGETPVTAPRSEPDRTIAANPATAHKLPYGPYSVKHYPRNPTYRLSRDVLREIAHSTLDALDQGFYYPPSTSGNTEENATDEDRPEQTVDDQPGAEDKAQTSEHERGEEGKEEEGTRAEGSGEEAKKEEAKEEQNHETQGEGEKSEVKDGKDPEEVQGRDEEKQPQGRKPYDLGTKISYTNNHTQFFGSEDERLARWADATNINETKKTRIIIGEYSTLVATRRMPHFVAEGNYGKTGLLNFASAKKPGGGFINGAQAQEESLARSSTLYPSLVTLTGKQFYKHYLSDPDNAFYTHSMIYSPSVVLFRDDKGRWVDPLEVDIITSAAVNAGDVRKQVRWEEEMRALRERVRVAEIARRRDMSLSVSAPPPPPAQTRKHETESPQQQAKDDENTTTSTAPDSSTEQSTSPSEPEAQPATSNSDSPPISPIIFASDPDPSLPPLGSPSHLSPLSQPFPGITTASSSSPNPPGSEDIDPLTYAETLIASTMYERIARILCLFHAQGVRHVILGAFGTGVFQNSVELVAGIFRDLLCEPSDQEEGEEKQDGADLEDKEGASEQQTLSDRLSATVGSTAGRGKFKGAFDTVLFAVLGGSAVRTFKQVFESAEGIEVDDDAEGSDVEGMKDGLDFRDGRD